MASKDDMLDGDEQAAPAKKAEGKKKGPMLLILIGLLVMIVTPAATWMVVRQSSAPSSEEGKAPKEPEAQPIVMAIDPLVVNISGTRMTRVLRIQVHLVLSEPRLQEVLTEMLPMVKDRVMSTAGRRTLDEMESIEDRESMKRDIALEINSLVRTRMAGSVLDVAFSEFLIQ